LKKKCPKIILEGTRLTHKTDIAFALNEHPTIVGDRQYRYHSPIISAEWCGFTNHPWGRGLINFSPKEEEKAMETYRTWLRLFELLPYYSWIVDRFHISTRAWQQKVNKKDYNFSWLESKMVNLGFHLVFCYRQPDSFVKAREERLQVSGKPSQYDDLQVFIDEQYLMLDMVRHSKLPLLELDITDKSMNECVERIAYWLKKSGGLWVKR
jgi:hypothetical protein